MELAFGDIENGSIRRVSITKLKLITGSNHAGLRIDEVLADFLTERLKRSVSKAKVRKLMMAGAVHLRGQRARIPSQGLLPGAEIEVHVDVPRLFGDATSRDRPFEVTAGRILFEDEDLIAIDKPYGLPSQPTVDETRDNLFAAVRRFLAKRDGTAKPYLGAHQRLDRDTSGVVLFTKTRLVNAPVGEIFSQHLGAKIYQALTSPPSAGLRKKLKREWIIKNYLGRLPSASKRARYGAVRTNGEFAETAFRVIAEYPRGLWIEAIPTTGRTHQIRVHLSEYGLPILGDDLYGIRNAELNGSVQRLMLHASQLVFLHPITKHELSIQSALPDDFRHCLEQFLPGSPKD
jgi:23S rRNA pseudouridine1911/1915/1917 synthase